jgi:hypothetical protein
MRTPRLIAAAAVALAIVAAKAHADSTATALECFDVKDHRGSAAAFPDLTITTKVRSLAESLHCSLTAREAKAKKLCTPASLLPDADPQGLVLKKNYLCYQITCPKGVDKDVTTKDRIGDGSLQVIRSRAKRTICVPTGKVGSASQAFIDPPSGLVE